MQAQPIASLHRGDLPVAFERPERLAVDTEATGLNLSRDRLCLVQLSRGDGMADIIQIIPDTPAPRLASLLADSAILKLFHFARFDIAMLKKDLHVDVAPIFCTRTASRLVRTYSDRHGLADVCAELLGVSLDKKQRSTDWGAPDLTPEQIAYAAADVLHLHALTDILAAMLRREGRATLAQRCFEFLPDRAALDLSGWPDEDVFDHS